MGLIHGPAGEDTRFFPEGTDQSGIAFEVHYTDFALAGQAQILSGDVHNDGKPLLVPVVPKHLKAGISGKEILAGGTVRIRQVDSQF